MTAAPQRNIHASVAIYTLFCTEMGWMGLVSTERGLFASVLPMNTREEAEAALLSRLPFQPVYRPEKLATFENSLKAYFTGSPLDFDCSIDWSWATPFQRRVLEVVKAIPFGECLSYGRVAALAGVPGGARAVGGALAKNMLPLIIPCHRVIKGNGSLGGFTGAPLSLKARMLSLEGAGQYIINK